ncbi:hypothetical protein GJQ54_09415 [Oceanospirillaceae bacterium ASx5O]|nr:hypothetical protein GJQ54_09415 [Oceanospirillaceae bacterium ASx5O]
MELFDRQGLKTATGLSDRKLNLLLRLLKGPQLEDIYNGLDEKEGLGVIDNAFRNMRIELDYDHEALRRALPAEGPFITVSNHPFGFLDGIILLLMVGRERPQFRAVANFLLSYFAPISDLFITVNPFENAGPKGMNGMKKSLTQLEQGLGLGLFPAGEVATRYPGSREITDRPWSLSSMKLIQKAQVPVIPIYFHGHNSRSFHWLGKIHPALRTLRIPAEFLKRRHSTIKISIGERIEWDEMTAYDTPEALREYLRGKTFALRDS